MLKTLWPRIAFLAVMLAVSGLQAQSSNKAQSTERPLGHWSDPDTGLMWTSGDTGRDIRWKAAVKYCRDLKLDGYADWRLPNLFELGGIYDPKANSPGLSGLKPSPTMWHVKGNLFLTLYEWSSDRPPDDRGHPSGWAYYYDFIAGKSNDTQIGWPYGYEGMRALCVRGTGDPLGGQRKAAQAPD
jgi:hypothetical protein